MEHLRKAAEQRRMLRLQYKDSSASIIMFLEDERFNLQSFVRGAPTGIETPPEPRHVGTLTFYYYGPGGGGVAYPDQYFFDLRGKTLTIRFDGPYEGKTPTERTKTIEQILLQTFRTF